MASKTRMRFPLPIPVNAVTLGLLLLVVAALYALSHGKKIPPPMNVKVAPDGQPGNPTGQQALDFRSQAQEQYPYQEPGANVIPGGNSWI